MTGINRKALIIKNIDRIRSQEKLLFAQQAESTCTKLNVQVHNSKTSLHDSRSSGNLNHAFITMYAAGNPLDLIRIGKPNIDQTTLNALSAYYGLNKPIPIQYLNWVNNILHLNFGKSLYGGQPVNT